MMDRGGSGTAGQGGGNYLIPRERGDRGTVALCVIGMATLLAATPLCAQSDPRLIEAVRTAQEGQSDSARAAVQRLLAATPPTDTLYPQILYTGAMVAGEAAEMRRSLQRVVVEHGASSWADDALLRLAQMDYATRAFQAAARNLEKLRGDYPLTPLLPQAAYWAARTYFDLDNPTLACRWLADGMARAQENLELQNQLGYLYQRCDMRAASGGAAGQRDSGADTTSGQRASGQAAPAQRAPDTSRAVDTAPGREPDSLARRPAAPLPRFRVQISAVATPGAADDVAAKAEGLGYSAVIVRERGLYKVRAGAFATRQEAQAAAQKLKAQLGGSPFVIAEP